jgi:hypothetical protein
MISESKALSGSARIPRFDLGLVVQNHVQQGIMDFQFSVVFDEAQFAELVHEKAHARSGRADVRLASKFFCRRVHFSFTYAKHAFSTWLGPGNTALLGPEMRPETGPT